MKILVSAHVVWWNASAYYAITAAQALARRGHDVTVLAHHSTPAFNQAQEAGLRTLGQINLLEKSPFSFWKIRRELAKFITEEKFDVLNPHRPEDHFYLALTNRRLGQSAKVIRTVSDVRAPRDNFINRRLHEKWTEGFIFCAHCCRERYQKLRLNHLPQTVIYSSLDIDLYIRGEWKANSPFLSLPSPRIGIIARLSPNKGHRTLIEAVAQVYQAGLALSCIVVGQEEEVRIADLKSYARELGVESAFTFTGRLDDPRPVMAACDIGVVASLDSEVISRATQEFFAFGIPVIATTVNVLAEMIQPEVNGLLVPPGDSRALAAAIVRLISSPELRQRLGAAALQTALTRHHIDVQGANTEAFFQTIHGR